MYNSEDDNLHQSNWTFVINESNMTLPDSFYGVMNYVAVHLINYKNRLHENL